VTLKSSASTTSACKSVTRRGIVDFLRPARARRPNLQSVSPKLYATKNPGGEIGPGIQKETPSKDHDAFDCITVPPVSRAFRKRSAHMVPDRGGSRPLMRGVDR
jgi:hypothetical protein